jgi:hypothetical protein
MGLDGLLPGYLYLLDIPCYEIWRFIAVATISRYWCSSELSNRIRVRYFKLDRLCGLVVRVPGYRSRGPGFGFLRYQTFWEVVGLERSPLSLVSTTEELLGRNSGGSGLENRYYGRGDPLRWPRDTLYQLKLALTSPTGCLRSVGIVRLRTKTTE